MEKLVCDMECGCSCGCGGADDFLWENVCYCPSLRDRKGEKRAERLLI